MDLSSPAGVRAALREGYAKVAARLGAPYTMARPQGASAPLAVTRGTRQASFSAEDYRYAKPAGYGDATMYGWFDFDGVQVCDYLTGEGRTLFVAAMQPMLPILAVLCNAVVRLTRHNAFGAPGDGTGAAVGAAPYSAVEEAGDEALLTGWPASVLLGGRSSGRGETDLPASVLQTGFVVLLPPSVPLEILHGDTLADDLGRRFSVVAAERSDLGWRLHATELHV